MIEKILVKSTQKLSVLLLITAYGSTIISKKIQGAMKAYNRSDKPRGLP